MVQFATTGVRLGGGASTEAIRGRGVGNGAAAVAGKGACKGACKGAAVCGAEIDPVISALACSSFSEILAIWLCAVLLAASRFAFSVVTSLPSLASDCCIALLSAMAAVSGLGGAWDPPLASAPMMAPSAAAKVTVAASKA